MMNKKKKKKNMSKFKRFPFLYIQEYLAAAMIICWSVLYVFIKDYEQG